MTAIHWLDYFWLYLFAATIGFSTTIAEPSLMAVALKARGELSPTAKVMSKPFHLNTLVDEVDKLLAA